MRAAECRRCKKNHKERRANAARRSLAFYRPRPRLLRGSTKESMPSKPKPSDGGSFTTTRGSVADAFFGASPVVASALGIRSGATPRGRFHCKPSPSALPRKEDISTLLGIGHFYFALTGAGRGHLSRPSEKFLNEPSRKFLLTAVRLKGGTNRDEPKGTRCVELVETG
jgi:hypothetical protein